MAIKDILKTHRTWEDGVGLVLGLTIGLSPWFYDEPVVPAVLLNSGLTGLAVLALAQLESERHRAPDQRRHAQFA
jgi:formate-dependent nitrite reductase membrane component NrfD